MATRTPDLEVYTVVETNTDRNFWVRLGSAWTNRDGSINVILNAHPVNGKLHIRKPRPKDAS